jgi:hypothetical protein
MLRRTIIVAALLSLAPLWLTPAAAARASFDGLWSVLIITDSGQCDRAYRYALRIENGRIRYDDPSFDVSGQVTPSGQVRVMVRYGQQQASGTGRLSLDGGEGVWSGRASGSRCSGHWEAERRG